MAILGNKDWSTTEKKKLLKIYLLFCQKEEEIFNNHGCDSWEDIFRDYDEEYIKDKTMGVEKI